MATNAPITPVSQRALSDILDAVNCWLEQAQGVINTVIRLNEHNDGSLDFSEIAALFGADALVREGRKGIENVQSSLLRPVTA